MKKLFRKYGRITIYAVLILVILFVFPLHIHQGNSMYPGIGDGDLLIAYRFASRHNQDVVLFRDKDGVYAGRIMAMAGQKVDIAENGCLQIDQTVMEQYRLNSLPQAGWGHQIGKDKYFLVFDNGNESSGSFIYGEVAQNAVAGRVIFVIRRRGI